MSRMRPILTTPSEIFAEGFAWASAVAGRAPKASDSAACRAVFFIAGLLLWIRHPGLREVAQLVLLDLGGIRAFCHREGVDLEQAHRHLALCEPGSDVADRGSFVERTSWLERYEPHRPQR